MLPNFSRFSRIQRGGERSPFSSPNSNLHASPVAARRSSLEERRRPAAKFAHGIPPDPTNSIDDEDQEEEDGEVEDQEEESDEDEAGELSPLLPIFSAAHLGSSTLPSKLPWMYSFDFLLQTLFQSITSPIPCASLWYNDARLLFRGTS